MKNKFIKVHQTASRLRYKYFLLKEKFIDENILKNYLEKIEDVKSVRINKKAFSIVFEIQSDISSKIEEILSSLTIEELLKYCENEVAAVCISCVGNEEPSLLGIIRASSGLISERFIQNDLKRIIKRNFIIKRRIRECFTKFSR